MENRILELEKKNEELKNKIFDLEKGQHEMLSYHLYTEARKKFMGWITAVIIIISAFGFVSISSIINNIKSSIEKKGTQKIIDAIKYDFDNKYGDQIEKLVQDHIESKTALMIQDEITTKFDQIDSMRSINKNLSLSSALDSLYNKERYIVIAGSSPNKRDLEFLLAKFQDKPNRDFESDFPNAQIISSNQTDGYFILSLGSNFSLKEAKRVKDLSLKYKVRKDIFIRRM